MLLEVVATLEARNDTGEVRCLILEIQFKNDAKTSHWFDTVSLLVSFFFL